MDWYDITDLQTEYLLGLIAYSRAQKSLWQQVPYLCAKANGKTGYAEQYSYAASFGYWRCGNVAGNYWFRIDCENGNILGWDAEKKVYDKATPHLLKLTIDDLDAETIVAELTKKVNEPVKYYMGKTSEQLAEEQEQEIQRWGIKPIYERRAS